MTTEKKNPVVSTVAQPSFDAAIRASKDDTKFDYNQRMAAKGNSQLMQQGQQLQQAVPTPTSTTERSLQTTADGGKKQVVKTTAPFTDLMPGVMSTKALVPNFREAIGRSTPAPQEGGAFGGAFETEGGGREPDISKMRLGPGSNMEAIRNVASVIPGSFAVPGPNAPPPTQPVLGGGTQQNRLAQQAVVPTAAPSVSRPTSPVAATAAQPNGVVPEGQVLQWSTPDGRMGFTDSRGSNTIPQGATITQKNFSDMGQGIFGGGMTSEERNAQLDRSIAADRGIIDTVNEMDAARRRSDYQVTLESEMQNSQPMSESDARMAGYRMQSELDTIARGNYDPGVAKQMQAGVIERHNTQTAGRGERHQKALDNYTTWMSNQDASSAKSATEESRAATDRQKMSLDIFKEGREAKYQDAQITKWAHDMGSSEYDRQISQAKNDDDAAQINRTFGTKAIEAEFAGQDKAAEALLLTNPEQAQKDIAAIAQEKKKRFKELRLRHPTRGAIEGLPQKDAQGNDIEVPIQWDGKHWIEYKARGVV